jgi:hypothetical protein
VVWGRCAQSNATLCCLQVSLEAIAGCVESTDGRGYELRYNAVATMIRYAHAALDVLAGGWIGGNNGVARGLKLPVPSSR